MCETCIKPPVFACCFFLLTVLGVEGGLKSQTPAGLGPDRIYSSGKKDATIRVKHAANGKNQASLKAMGRNKGHYQSDCSESYTTDEASADQRDSVPTMHILSQPSGTYLPLQQVNQFPVHGAFSSLLIDEGVQHVKAGRFSLQLFVANSVYLVIVIYIGEQWSKGRHLFKGPVF